MGREFQNNSQVTLNLAIASCTNKTISPRLPTALCGSPGSHVSGCTPYSISTVTSAYQRLHNRTLPRRLEHSIPTWTTQHARKSDPELPHLQRESLRCDQASRHQGSTRLHESACNQSSALYDENFKEGIL